MLRKIYGLKILDTLQFHPRDARMTHVPSIGGARGDGQASKRKGGVCDDGRNTSERSHYEGGDTNRPAR